MQISIFLPKEINFHFFWIGLSIGGRRIILIRTKMAKFMKHHFEKPKWWLWSQLFDLCVCVCVCVCVCARAYLFYSFISLSLSLSSVCECAPDKFHSNIWSRRKRFQFFATVKKVSFLFLDSSISDLCNYKVLCSEKDFTA